jgi:hypothetical protein
MNKIMVDMHISKHLSIYLLFLIFFLMIFMIIGASSECFKIYVFELHRQLNNKKRSNKKMSLFRKQIVCKKMHQTPPSLPPSPQSYIHTYTYIGL